MRLLLLLFILAGCSADVPETPVIWKEKPVVRVPLPKKCSEFRREPDPETWDEEKEEYPPNIEWEECMGVGRR